MTINNKKKRINEQNYLFFKSCFFSLLGVAAYFLGAYVFSFPLNSIIRNKKFTEKDPSIFFNGMQIIFSTDFTISILFAILSAIKPNWEEGISEEKFKKWRNLLRKSFLIIGTLISLKRILSDQKLGLSFGKKILIALIAIVANCCTIEWIIQFINKQGICRASSLIYSFDIFPYKFIKNGFSDQKQFWNFLQEFSFLFALTWIFTYLSNIEWKFETDVNSLNIEDKKWKRKKYLAFNTNWSFMPISYASYFLNFLIHFFNGKSERFETELKIIEEKKLFNLDKIKIYFKKKRGISFFTFFIFFQGLITWLEKRLNGYNAAKIKDNLKRKGIYVNGLAQDEEVEKMIKEEVNKMVIIWFLNYLVFKFAFDNLIKTKEISFLKWFFLIDSSLECFRQIKNRYRYIQVNK